jgi:hypothetical protein
VSSRHRIRTVAAAAAVVVVFLVFDGIVVVVFVFEKWSGASLLGAVESAPLRTVFGTSIGISIGIGISSIALVVVSVVNGGIGSGVRGIVAAAAVEQRRDCELSVDYLDAPVPSVVTSDGGRGGGCGELW